MSLSVLNDDEFSARLHEGRSFLDGLKAEADARGLLTVATDLALAQEAAAQAVKDFRRAQLKAWEFMKPDGAVDICSWCQVEHKAVPQQGESHGVCPRHLAEWRESLQRRKEAVAA